MKTTALVSVTVAATLSGTVLAAALVLPEIATDRPSPRAAPADPESSDDLQRLADDVFRSFSGSRYERDADAVLAAYALNGRQAECMHDNGYPGWDWSLPRAMNPENHGLEDSVFFHPPGTTPFADMKMIVSPMLRADDTALAKDTSDREMQAGLDCLKTTPQTPEADASTTPRGVNRLREQWWQMLSDLDHELGDQDDYWTCLSKARVEGTGDIASNEALLGLLESLAPPAEELPTSPTSSEASAPGWRALVGLEQGWRAADFSCRADVYDAGIDEVEAAILDFAADHATDIAAARAAWAGVVEQAETLGYAGRYESLLVRRP